MLLSVIIPAYNEQENLERCVTSVIAGSGESSEVIVVDDGSTDNTIKVVQNLQRAYPNVRLLRHAGNRNEGVAATRNLGLNHAAGKYIAFIDADDFCLPTRFAESLSILEQKGDLDGVLVTVGVIFGADAKGVDRTYLPEVLNQDPGILPDDFAGATLQGRSRFHISNLIFRKSLLAQSGNFNRRLRLGEEDLDLWLRMALCGRFGLTATQEPQVFYRRHAGNNWSPNKNDYFRDLMVVGGVLRWARSSPWVSIENVDKVQEAFFEKLFFCLNVARAERMTTQGMKAAFLAALNVPDVLLTRRYWANVTRLVFR